jgi:hypothetical protein
MMYVEAMDSCLFATMPAMQHEELLSNVLVTTFQIFCLLYSKHLNHSLVPRLRLGWCRFFQHHLQRSLCRVQPSAFMKTGHARSH